MDAPDWADRFWSKVDKNGPVPQHRPQLGPCWLWTGYVMPSGYGRFRLGDQMTRAHRAAYELGIGWIPENMVIDHLCRVRHCVNWDHLEAVTVAVNNRRSQRTPAIRRGARSAQRPRRDYSLVLRALENVPF